MPLGIRRFRRSLFLRTALVTALIGGLSAGTAAGVLAAPQANSPTASPGGARAQVTSLQLRMLQATEEYDIALEQLQASQAKIERLRQQALVAQAKVDA